MAYQWDWQVFCRDTLENTIVSGCFGQDGGHTYLDWMISAWGWTLAVAGCGWLIALMAGIVVGTLRTTGPRWIQWAATAWVELFRNIPLLVQIFMWYHVVPALVPAMREVSPFVLVIVGLGLFTSARVAEQVRAGIQALPRGQAMAGAALGLTTVQTYRYVILPMALRLVLPPLTSEAMNIIKNSSVAFAVSIAELTLFAMQAQEETSRGIEIYLGVTALYVVSAFGVNQFMGWLERRVRVPGLVGAGK